MTNPWVFRMIVFRRLSCCFNDINICSTFIVIIKPTQERKAYSSINVRYVRFILLSLPFHSFLRTSFLPSLPASILFFFLNIFSIFRIICMKRIFIFKKKGVKNNHPLIAFLNADFPVPLSPVTPNRIFTSFRAPNFHRRIFSMS